MSVLLGGLGAAGAGAAAAAGWYVLPFAARRRGERRLRERCRRERTLVLSFDDGPGPELTPRVLDVLRDHGARATFFVLGRRALLATPVLDRMRDEGHEIGSHSMEHLNAWKAPPFRAARDAERSYRELSRWLAPHALFRPPYGKITADLWWSARSNARPLGWWTRVSGDTYPELPSVTGLCDAVRTDGGGVVLLHDFDRRTADAAARARFVLDATSGLLAMARDEGLAVRTLSDALGGDGA